MPLKDSSRNPLICPSLPPVVALRLRCKDHQPLISHNAALPEYSHARLSQQRKGKSWKRQNLHEEVFSFGNVWLFALLIEIIYLVVLFNWFY